MFFSVSRIKHKHLGLNKQQHVPDYSLFLFYQQQRHTQNTLTDLIPMVPRRLSTHKKSPVAKSYRA